MKEPYAILDGRTLPLERTGAEEVIRWRLPRVAVPADTREVIVRFPFLDAGAGEEGYYLVPSKQACFLMNFRQREDLTYENEEALMTMFGARIGDTAWLAVTEGMDYDYRLRITVRQGHYEISMVYDLTKADFYEDLVVAFYPLTGENADYSGVARKYRQLQAAKLHLVPLAEQISRWRAEYSAAIVEDMADTCQQFLPEFTLTFSFQRGWEKETDYAEVLERNFERDRMLTYTAHGPHKADFRIRADGAPVEDTLSRGQLKLLMCALRLAQGEFLTRVSGRRCLYLIDDFASELDDARRGLLSSRLKATQSQVFVSAISAEHVMDMSDKNSKMFRVEKGKITD